MGDLGDRAEQLIYVMLASVGILACSGTILVCCIVGCALTATLYSFGCLTYPQYDNNDIPMDIIQADLEATGNDADLAEAI